MINNEHAGIVQIFPIKYIAVPPNSNFLTVTNWIGPFAIHQDTHNRNFHFWFLYSQQTENQSGHNKVKSSSILQIILAESINHLQATIKDPILIGILTFTQYPSIPSNRTPMKPFLKILMLLSSLTIWDQRNKGKQVDNPDSLSYHSKT